MSSRSVIILSVIMLSVVFLGAITLSIVMQICLNDVEHRYTECHCTVGVIKLSVTRLSVVYGKVVFLELS